VVLMTAFVFASNTMVHGGFDVNHAGLRNFGCGYLEVAGWLAWGITSAAPFYS